MKVGHNIRGDIYPRQTQLEKCGYKQDKILDSLRHLPNSHDGKPKGALPAAVAASRVL